MKRGADVYTCDDNGSFPVAMAEYHKHRDIVDYFYDTGLVMEQQEEEVVEYWHCHICTKANVLNTNMCVTCGRLNKAVIAAREAEEEEKTRVSQMSRIKAMGQGEGDGEDNSMVSNITEASSLTKHKR